MDDLHPNLVVPTSKAFLALFTKMRDVKTSSEDFGKAAQRCQRILAEEALAEFPTSPCDIETPCGPFRGVSTVSPEEICAVSIVRSGDALLESVRLCEPAVRVGKILIQRNENHPDKIAELYYSKLPPKVSEMHVLLCDPMLATGSSAIMALEVLVEKYTVDPNRIIFANMICAPEGLKALATAYPQVKIVTACVDDRLNDDKYIVPGLGDYGDRFFNT
mmetsp:Transcript_4494/g.6633  ORF Transcript_4494/g.6633 Transcript_4494/m.6633 type:complete len:219 (+) Transcript_4494:25-681(+)